MKMKIGFLLLICCGLIFADTDDKTDTKTKDEKVAAVIVEVNFFKHNIS